jgi:hypothetical protein
MRLPKDAEPFRMRRSQLRSFRAHEGHSDLPGLGRYPVALVVLESVPNRRRSGTISDWVRVRHGERPDGL